MRDVVRDARRNNLSVLSCCLGPDRRVGQGSAGSHYRPFSSV